MQSITEILNPYEKKFEKKEKKKSPIHRLVDLYLELRGWANLSKEMYKELKINYPRLCREAKMLFEACGGNEKKMAEEDASWAIYQLSEDAKKIGFNWTIKTALTYKRFNDK